jgi:hypothetical protein
MSFSCLPGLLPGDHPLQPLEFGWQNTRYGKVPGHREGFKMKIGHMNIPVLTLVVILLASCSIASDAEQAHEVLIRFFDSLQEEDFREAADLYGGSYELLNSYNPDLDPEDREGLLARACQQNGFQCLQVQVATFNELTENGEYVFTVQFLDPNGELFVLGPCCGEEPETPPEFQFEYRVVKNGFGDYQVLDLPVYVP